MVEEIRIHPKMPGNTLNAGEFNKILSKLNQLIDASNKNEANFTKVDNSITKNRGYFETSTLLNSEIPIPKVGETAWVGTPYPGVVYDCVVKGTWRNTNVSAEDALRALLNNMIDTLATTEDLDAINIILNQKFDSVTLEDGILSFLSNGIVVGTIDISTDILNAASSANQSAIDAQQSATLALNLKNQCNDLFNSCNNAKNSAISAAEISVAAKDIIEQDKIVTSQYKNRAVLAEQNAKASELAAEGFKNTASQQATISTNKALESSNSAAAALVSEQHAKDSDITAGQQATIATNKAEEVLGYRNETEGYKNTVLANTIFLGGIAHNATAPTPGKSGYYEFTSVGTKPAWLTGEVATVGIGDRVIVVYDNTYTYTYQANPNTIFLGGIAHNAAAPTPSKSGIYEFTSMGICSWLGGTSVAIGDRVIVVYDTTYTYTYQANPNTNIVQATGTGENVVMSQKAVTDGLIALENAVAAATVYLSANDYQILIDNELTDPDVEYNIYE